MPVPNLLIGSIGRLLTALERRRGLVVLIFAGLLLAIGTSTSLVGRPPVLTPTVEGLTGALMAGLSQPVRLARYLIGSRPSSAELMRLELELASLRRAEAENRRLRAMLRFPPGRAGEPHATREDRRMGRAIPPEEAVSGALT